MKIYGTTDGVWGGAGRDGGYRDFEGVDAGVD